VFVLDMLLVRCPFSSFVITNITSLLLSGHVQVLENTKDHM